MWRSLAAARYVLVEEYAMACKRSAANKISCCCVAGTGARSLCKQKLRYLAWVEEYVLFEHSMRLFQYATYIHSDPPPQHTMKPLGMW